MERKRGILKEKERKEGRKDGEGSEEYWRGRRGRRGGKLRETLEEC